MHICVVTETYPPEINGVAVTVHGLVEGMAARGHQVSLVRPRQPGSAETPSEGPVDTMQVAGASIPRYPALRFGLPARRRLLRRWRAHRPDVLYIATEGPLGACALRCARKLGIPATTGFHTRFDHYAAHYGLGWLTPLVRAYLRRFHRRATATLVPTQALADELKRMGVRDVKLLHRAVDTVHFHPRHRDAALREQWGVDATAPVALYVGRMAPEKNLQLAIQAFHAMRARRPDMRFVWVGDGPERSALQQAHPECIFAGMQQGEALARHYASADLFVFPSLSETFGLVILEALASGLPVIGFDRGATHEHMQDGINGSSIANEDPQAFTAACVEWVGVMPDDSIRKVARDSVSHLRPETVIADCESILRCAAFGAAATPERPVQANASPLDDGAQP